MGKARKIDWLNHGLEFIVVIFGILLAFQLNECSEDRSNRNYISTHIKQIEAETDLNTFFMGNGIKYAEIELDKVDSVLQLLETQGDHRLIDSLLQDVIYFNGIYIRKNAYHSIMESGDFKLIEDIELKQNIINIYEYYTWVESFNQNAFTVFDSELYPYIQDNFDRKNNTFKNETPYSAVKLRNILYSYRIKLSLRLKKLKSCLEEMDAFLKTLPT